jgi:uncharacterized protein
MKCPVCKKPLLSTLFNNVEVDYCPFCLGFWFDENELRYAKDASDENLNWLDTDLWKNEKDFKVSRGIRICPHCRVPLYEVYYGNSRVAVDVCNLCHGVWLDRAEFKKIMDWLSQEANNEVLHNYTKNLFKQSIEVFTGPETIREEILDFITILKLLNYKFAAQHPLISKMISEVPW